MHGVFENVRMVVAVAKVHVRKLYKIVNLDGKELANEVAAATTMLYGPCVREGSRSIYNRCYARMFAR